MMIFRAFVNVVSEMEDVVRGNLGDICGDICFHLCILLEYYAP